MPSWDLNIQLVGHGAILALVRNKVWPWVGAQGLLLCWKQEERGTCVEWATESV